MRAAFETRDTTPELASVGESVEMGIQRIAAGGDGVGRAPSGRVVFVPRTAPGDRVEVTLVESHDRWARAVPDRWLEKSPLRREAPCPAYRECGGCRLQHVRPEEQARSKSEIVRDALRRIGRLDVPVEETLSGELELGYRNRVTFTMRRNAGVAKAGYRRLHRPEELVESEDCLLAEASIRRAWQGLRQVWGPGAERLPDGDQLRLTLRASSRGEVDLLVDGGRPWHGEDGEALLDGVPGLVGCHQRRGSGRPIRVAGAPRLTDRWQGLEFLLPPGVFLQVNREISARMDTWLDERAEEVAGQKILDLYSGVGARAIRWAKLGARVTACEVQPDAVEAGQAVAAREGTDLEFRRERVERAIVDLLPADLIVVNPPRAGLGREVSSALSRSSSRRLAYVSCDPATLARDLARLSEAWTIRHVQPFDAFPQTAHVETIAWLERETGASEGGRSDG